MPRTLEQIDADLATAEARLDVQALRILRVRRRLDATEALIDRLLTDLIRLFAYSHIEGRTRFRQQLQLLREEMRLAKREDEEAA
jgi:hypothetical protein